MIKMETNILALAQAVENCIKSNNHEWYARHQENVINTLLGVLPHGSGIDCKWLFDITDKTLECHNSYHVMAKDGYYDGYVDFAVKIKTGHRDIDGKLDFAITGQFGKNQDIKDYLYETIAFALYNN